MAAASSGRLSQLLTETHDTETSIEVAPPASDRRASTRQASAVRRRRADAGDIGGQLRRLRQLWNELSTRYLIRSAEPGRS